MSATGGVFAVSPARVTVPAGSTASVHVTADTRADVPDGLITGSVTATAPDGTAARTALAVHKEVESYTLTLEGLDRGGQASVFAADMFSHDSFRGLNLHSEDGTATARVAKADMC
ncbi:hypothetical protein [Allorhizocola rhizosphaerae]|uniref:hypothetical protein n=1 Tax=Allorhizocola rhizosphaerae TaxID=1872709 RepID=UPI000E3C625D|nr:hypothetical protein [Allorhizocola rhizosphaerae]